MDNVQNNIPQITQMNTLNNFILPPPPINQLFSSGVAEPPQNNGSMHYASNQLNQENNNEEHKKRKRATKKESDIRNFKCNQCDKSYLSYPALYTHCKQKHNTNNHSGRNRGRPKKEQNEAALEKEMYDPLTNDFSRRKKELV